MKAQALAGNNVYWKLSVFQQAVAEQYQENFGAALKLYEKFAKLNPEPRKDQFSPRILETNLGICYAKMGDLSKSEDQIERAITKSNSSVSTLPRQWQGFLTLIEGYTNSTSKEDSKKAVRFIDKLSVKLMAEPLTHAYFAPRILKLAQAASTPEKLDLALRLYSMVPKTNSVLQAGSVADESRINEYQKRAYASWKTKAEEGEPMEMSAYFGLSKLYEEEGDIRGSFVIYDYMGTHFLKTKHRPTILYAATKTAADLTEMGEAQVHGLNFLKEFPDHEYQPAVSSLLLSSMFFNGEYERCLEIAADLRKTMKVGDKMRDLPDFVTGGSLYYLGRYKEAQPELDSHVENYKESPYFENSSYYQASNLIKLFDWSRASKLLDVWLEMYEPKKSPLLDVAYLDRGTCHFALSSPENGGNQKALEFANKIISGLPNSAILDRAYGLKADVQQNEGMLPESEESYKQSLALAETAEHSVTASTALMQLVNVASAQEKFKEAIAYYDEFFQKYPTSFYAPNTAVAALSAFQEAAPNKLDDALDRVKDLIVKLGENSDSDGVEATLNSYTNFLLKEKQPNEVIDILDRFPNKLGYRTLEAWLLITKIGLVEERLADDARMNAKARVYYEALETDFKKDELGDFILYRLGAKIAETNPFKAQPWFEQVAKSESPELAMQASLQLAMIDSQSKEQSVKGRAIKSLEKIRTNLKDNPAMVGPATLTLARLHHDAERWKDANKEWKAYMTNKSFRDARPEALFKLGESYEKLGEQNAAVTSFSQITVLYAGYLDLSAEAVLRVSNIVWNRGDHLKAFRYLNTFHFRMKENDHAKVKAMGVLREDFIQQMKSSGEWKEEYQQVRSSFGKIEPSNN